MVNEKITTVRLVREQQQYRGESFDIEPERFQIQIPNAEKRIMDGIRYFCGDRARWLGCYSGVADWLTDNKGRGLLLIGPCGTGKSLLCTKIIPVLLRCAHRYKIFPMYSAHDMNKKAQELLDAWFVILDDVGLETQRNDFGNKTMVFSELVDKAERMGTVLVLNTNLSVDELTEKYGERTVDRLRAITRVIVFDGESMRG